MAASFRGIVPALITPMTPTEDVDENGLRVLTDRLIDAGVHGFFVLGTNGEFIALSEEEKLRIVRITAKQARGRVPVMTGTDAYATRDVIALNHKMQDVGAGAVSAITPYFNGATQPELLAHYEQIVRATSLPILLYTIPAKADVTLTIDTVRRLADIPNIRAIKDSSGDFDHLLQFINLHRDGFAVSTGTNSMILWALIAGGDGAVAATTNAVPHVVISIWNQFQVGNIPAARVAQESLRALCDALALGIMPVVLKTTAEMLGMPAGPARSPAKPLGEKSRERLAKALAIYRTALNVAQALPPAPASSIAMSSSYHFQAVKHIIHGTGSLALLPEKLALFDVPVKRIALITQPMMEQNGVIGRVVQALAVRDIEAHIVHDAEPEPTIENVETVFREQIVPFTPDAILSIGSGSVLDAAKLFAVRLTNEQPLREWLGIDLIKRPGIPLVSVPTTAGTGSGVTPNAIVTLSDEELKVGIVSRYLLSQMVILDAKLTFDLPKPITAATDIDAFVHSLESYILTETNPTSDMFAMESMRLIGANLVEAYQNGRSVRAREAMMLGSMYGGLTLTAVGTVAVYALAYPLGGMFGITHGVANAMLLSHVMSFNKDAIVGRLGNVARALNISSHDTDDETAADALIGQLTEWTDIVQIPQDLHQSGVSETHLDVLAETASKVKRLLGNNPKPLSHADIKAIYQRLLP